MHHKKAPPKWGEYYLSSSLLLAPYGFCCCRGTGKGCLNLLVMSKFTGPPVAGGKAFTVGAGGNALNGVGGVGGALRISAPGGAG